MTAVRPGVALLGAALLAGGGACRRSAMPPRADGAAVVYLAADAGGPAGVTFADEREPNDSVASAQALSFADGQTVLGITGKPVAGKDVDVFRVAVPAGSTARRRLSVEVLPQPTLAVAVAAIDAKGAVVAGAGAGSPGEREGLPNLPATPDGVLLRISCAGTGAYRLLVRLAPLGPGEEVEPNGDAASATPLDVNGEVSGYVGWRRDEDWYRLTGPGVEDGAVLSAEVDAIPGVAVALAVHDCAAVRIAEQRGRAGARVSLGNASLATCDGGGHGFVVVRSVAGRSLDAPYVLRVRTGAPRTGAEVEPNDDAEHATALVAGTTTGSLGLGDVDVFRFAGAGPVELNVELVPPKAQALALEALDGTGGVLRQDVSGRRGEAARLVGLRYVTGTLLLRVSASGKGGGGGADRSYRLVVRERGVEAGDEVEPNGDSGSATLLLRDMPGSGTLWPKGDVDVWQIDGTAGAGASIVVTIAGVSGLALDGRVTTLAGAEVGHAAGAVGAALGLRATPGSEACCYVIVREATGKASNPKDRYAVTVTR